MMTAHEQAALDDLSRQLVDGRMMHDVRDQYRSILAGFICLMHAVDSIDQMGPFLTKVLELADTLGAQYRP